MLINLPAKSLDPAAGETLRPVLESMTQAVVVMDHESLPIRANSVLHRLLGCGPAELEMWRARRESMLDRLLAPECRAGERARFALLTQRLIDQYFSQVVLRDINGRRGRGEIWVRRCERDEICYLLTLRDDRIVWSGRGSGPLYP